MSNTIALPTGASDPDIAFMAGPHAGGVIGVQAIVVYRLGGNAIMDIFDVTNIGAGLAISPSVTMGFFLGAATTPPHVDGAYDPSTSPTGPRSMHEFVVAWEDAGDIYYFRADIASPIVPAIGPVVSNALFSDIAFFTSAGSLGGDRYIAIPFYNTATNELQVYEEQLSTGSVTIHTLHRGVDAYAPRIAAMDVWDGGPIKWEVAASVDILGGPMQRAVYGYNDQTAPVFTPVDMSSLLASMYSPFPTFQVMGACVAAGLGNGSGSVLDIGNTQFSLGFYPWQYDSIYARHISLGTGALINPGQCYQVNDPGSPANHPWDLNKDMAITNASNSGRDMLTAWYNGTNIVYKYSTPNVMAFRRANPNAMNAAAAGLKPSAYGLRPGDSYTIRDISGRLIRQGQADERGGIAAGDVAAGMYLLEHIDEKGRVVTTKFNR